MAVKDFRDLMPDLQTTDSSTDVHVSSGADPIYHCPNSDCKAKDKAFLHPRIIPLKLAKWLGYERMCIPCKKCTCEVCRHNIR